MLTCDDNRLNFSGGAATGDSRNEVRQEETGRDKTQKDNTTKYMLGQMKAKEVFSCVLATILHGLSVRPSVRPFVRSLVRPFCSSGLGTKRLKRINRVRIEILFGISVSFHRNLDTAHKYTLVPILGIPTLPQ